MRTINKVKLSTQLITRNQEKSTTFSFSFRDQISSRFAIKSSNLNPKGTKIERTTKAIPKHTVQI